jgi:hypothetical protein
MDKSDIIELSLFYSDRASDVELPSNLDKFLRIVEARVNRAFRVGKQSMRASIDLASAPADQQYFSMPSDFGGLRDIQHNSETDGDGNTGITTMHYVSPEQMNNYINCNYNGRRIFYTLIANQVQVFPIKDTGTMEIVYYQKIAPLINDTDTNWLSDESPDAYVFGMMVEISAFTKNADSSQLWNGRFTDTLTEIDNDDKQDRWSGTALQVRLG